MALNNIHLDNSESSAAEDRGDALSEEERNVRIFSKQMLQGRLFLGHFQERRLVEPLQAYRDVVIVNDSELQLKNDISIVRKRLKNYYKHDCWIGITEPTSIGAPKGHCFWIESNNETFGQYWFKIKSIQFRRREVLIKVKMIRPMTYLETEINNINESQNVSYDILLENYKNALKENTIWFMNEVVTWQNIKQTITFISILIVTLFTYIIYSIQFLMEFILRLMREFSVFVQASTPVMIAVVNVVGKLIGGFYILIAMLFRKQPTVPESQQRMIYYQNRPRAIEMPGYRPDVPRYRKATGGYMATDSLTITEVE